MEYKFTLEITEIDAIVKEVTFKGVDSMGKPADKISDSTKKIVATAMDSVIPTFKSYKLKNDE